MSVWTKGLSVRPSSGASRPRFVARPALILCPVGLILPSGRAGGWPSAASGRAEACFRGRPRSNKADGHSQARPNLIFAARPRSSKADGHSQARPNLIFAARRGWLTGEAATGSPGSEPARKKGVGSLGRWPMAHLGVSQPGNRGLAHWGGGQWLTWE